MVSRILGDKTALLEQSALDLLAAGNCIETLDGLFERTPGSTP
jgi:hypothetical protein